MFSRIGSLPTTSPEADADGRYGYREIDLFPLAISEEHRRYPVTGQAQVSQYGADYVRLGGSEPLTIRFQGNQQAQIVNRSAGRHFGRARFLLVV